MGLVKRIIFMPSVQGYQGKERGRTVGFIVQIPLCGGPGRD